MLPNKFPNESSIINLTNEPNLTNNSSSSNISGYLPSYSSFVELNENDDFKKTFQSHQFDGQGCFQIEQPINLMINEQNVLPKNEFNNDNFKLIELNDNNLSDENSSNPYQNYLNKTLDYHPANRSSSSSSKSTSSNQTDENSNEFDSFLKSDNSQTNYINRIKKKMKYKIKGVQIN